LIHPATTTTAIDLNTNATKTRKKQKLSQKELRAVRETRLKDPTAPVAKQYKVDPQWLDQVAPLPPYREAPKKKPELSAAEKAARKERLRAWIAHHANKRQENKETRRAWRVAATSDLNRLEKDWMKDIYRRTLKQDVRAEAVKKERRNAVVEK
jgi:hypothetical protein